MIFEMMDLYSKRVSTFSKEEAPDWLTSANQVPGSTMDSSWFWEEHVLTLEPGQSVNTDFKKITRLS